MPTGAWKPRHGTGKVQLPQPLEALVRSAKYALVGLALVAAGSAQAAGIGVRAGTTGVGADVAFGIAPTLSARLGYSAGEVNHDVTTNLTYRGKLKLSNLNTFLDWSPLGPFRITGGFIFNDNKFDVVSDPVNGVNVSGTVKPEKSAAPYLGIGYGNVSGAGVNFYADLGVMFQGTPQATLTANCGAFAGTPQCTNAQNQVAAEQQRLQDELKNAKYYPVLNIGITIGF
jgi:hypothetical protein